MDKLKPYTTIHCMMNKDAFFRNKIGIQVRNIFTLLGYDSPVEFPNWRGLIYEELGHYIERTQRFKETQDLDTCILIFSPFFPIIYFRSLFDILGAFEKFLAWPFISVTNLQTLYVWYHFEEPSFFFIIEQIS